VSVGRAAAVTAAAILVRRLGLSPRVLAIEVGLGVAACGIMVVVFRPAAREPHLFAPGRP
jgi:hypothetical protein